LQSVTLDKLEPGDNITVKHGELIPADSILLKGEAEIDYSFVTGESEPIHRSTGEKIYAGGRQTGGSIELSLTRRVSQSYLTQLWNDDAFTKKQDSRTSELADRVGKVFTVVILLIAFATLAYWVPRSTSTAINAFTAVLIIACPCAVALAVPFIFGNGLRILSRHRFFLKNTAIIEAISNVQAVVFDKTGTLTQRERSSIRFHGEPLDAHEKQMIKAILEPSSHPISQQLATYLQQDEPPTDDCIYQLKGWEEQTGRGVQGEICQRHIKVGSPAFMDKSVADAEGVYVQVNGEIRGYFVLENNFRDGIWKVADYYAQSAELHLLSGDNDREKAMLAPAFKDKGAMHFRQSPQDKLRFIKKLQNSEKRVMMLGDGLNDAGALQQSNAGIVIAENTNNFTPACDAILDAKAFALLPRFTQFAKRSIRLVYYAYGFAFIYNVIGLSFAVQGTLSPIVAAILMPLSSISIVLFGMLASNVLARRMGL